MSHNPNETRIVVTGVVKLRNTPSGNPAYQVTDALGMSYQTDKDSACASDAANLKPGQLAVLTIDPHNGKITRISSIPLINLNLKGN